MPEVSPESPNQGTEQDLTPTKKLLSPSDDKFSRPALRARNEQQPQEARLQDQSATANTRSKPSLTDSSREFIVNSGLEPDLKKLVEKLDPAWKMYRSFFKNGDEKIIDEVLNAILTGENAGNNMAPSARVEKISMALKALNSDLSNISEFVDTLYSVAPLSPELGQKNTQAALSFASEGGTWADLLPDLRKVVDALNALPKDLDRYSIPVMRNIRDDFMRAAAEQLQLVKKEHLPARPK